MTTARRRSGRGTRRRSALAIVAGGSAMLLTVALTTATGVVLTASYLVPGLVLAVRRPGQRIAWLLLLIAGGVMLSTTVVHASAEELVAGTATSFGELTAWANGTGWSLIFGGLIGIALVFPNGDWPDGRAGWFARLLMLAYGLLALLLVGGPIVNVTLPTQPYGVDVPNPLALPVIGGWRGLVEANGSLWAAMFALTMIAMGTLFVRFRRSSGLQRQQYRWLAWAIALVAVAVGAWAVVRNVLQADLVGLTDGLIVLSLGAIPVAVAIAVLRYRLYEIDRLVSRTLGWGIATAAVVTGFALLVLSLQASLAGVTQGGTVAVAASTLLAAAAFQPVRTRVQAVVDRRFDRPRLEAEGNLAAYGERLQQEVDIDALVRDVEDTVARTIRPSATGIWIRGA